MYSVPSSAINLLFGLDLLAIIAFWPAAGSEDTELSVNMEPEVDHGTTEGYARVQA